MNITLWTDFAKKKNSTKQPSTAGVVKSVYLKENTSLESPVFVISEPVTPYVYCLWGNYYYYVVDVVNLDAHRSEIMCEMDALATNKINIGNYTAFVERAASSYDTMVPDNFLSAKQEIVSNSSAVTSTAFNVNGVYCIPLTCKYGVRVHIFDTLAAAAAFSNASQYNKVSTPGIQYTVNEIDDIITTLGFQAFNLTDYLGQMYWLPFSSAQVGDTVAAIACGIWDLNVAPGNYPVLGVNELFWTSALTLPDNYYNDWKAASPMFSRYTVFLPGVGLIELSPLDCFENDLNVDVSCDLYTGAVNYRIYHTGGATVTSCNGQISVMIPNGKTAIDVGSLISNVIGGVLGVGAAVATGGASAAVASGISSAVGVANNLLSPQTSISGGNGNKAVLQEIKDIIVSLTNYDCCSYPTTVAGRPLYQNVQISSLSGYVKCGAASVDIVGIGLEKDVINSYLNSGFYYE